MTAVPQKKPVTVAGPFDWFGVPVAVDVNGIAVEPVDFDPIQRIFGCEIAAIAVAPDFNVINTMIELDADRNRKGRRQRPPAPWSP